MLPVLARDLAVADDRPAAALKGGVVELWRSRTQPAYIQLASPWEKRVLKEKQKAKQENKSRKKLLNNYIRRAGVEAASRPSTLCAGCGARLCVKSYFAWPMDRNLSLDIVVSMTQKWNQPNGPTTAPAKCRRGPASALPSSTA